MPSTVILAPSFQRLRQRARQSPNQEALRGKRRGLWHGLSWGELAHEVELAARGWASLGVIAGDTIVTVGPLSAAFIVTLFAAEALGAAVAPADGDTSAEQLAAARFAFADGAHELERVLRKRGVWLQHVVVGDGTHVPAAPPLVNVFTADALREAGRGAGPLPESFAADDAAWLTALHDSERVFADFEPAWAAGLAYLRGHWIADASRLVVPEPGGDVLADRREAEATLWLTPAERLNQFKQAVLDRVPTGWLRGLGARAALSDRGGALGAVARARLRDVLGLRQVRSVRTDAGADGTGLHLSSRILLRSLGIACVALLPSPGPARPAPVRQALSVPEALFQPVLAGGTP